MHLECAIGDAVEPIEGELFGGIGQLVTHCAPPLERRLALLSRAQRNRMGRLLPGGGM